MEYSQEVCEELYAKSDFKHAIGYRFLTGIWNIKL